MCQTQMALESIESTKIMVNGMKETVKTMKKARPLRVTFPSVIRHEVGGRVVRATS